MMRASNFAPSVCLLGLNCSMLGCAGKAAPESAPPTTASAETDSTERRRELEASQIVYAMGSEVEDYRKCFMRAFQSRGLVETRFDVNARGVVEDVAIVRSTIDKDYVPRCIRQRLLKQRFGQLSGPSRGHWTFVYRLTEKLDDQERQELLEEDAQREHGPPIAIAPESRGSLDPEAIEDATLAGYPLYAHCYRDSIQRRGESRGILSLRLSIDEQGHLTRIEDAGSILPDPFAVDCIAEAFYAIDFPTPEGGSVVANYRLELE